jgi:uncharacterized protein (TIGR03437 family)
MRQLYLAIASAALCAIAPQAFAQAPVIESGGVQNTASNIALASIAPQVLITIKGRNLATSTAEARGYPLPTKLGGATVTFTGANGTLFAPLIYASPTQIDAQAPSGITGAGITVSTAAGSSAPYAIPLVTGTYPYPVGPLGIFSQDTSGCGQAVAYNVHQDGSVSLNTPQNSLDPLKDAGLTIYLTGLGSLDFTDRQAGIPWTYKSSDNLVSWLMSSVTFGAPGLTATAADLTLAYLGPAPGKVGVDQANALGQWQAWPQGCKVPLSLSLLNPETSEDLLNTGPPVFAWFNSTQLVDVSIQPGGGVCADPPNGGLGILTWQTTLVSDATGSSSSAAVTAQFIQSDGLGFATPGQQATFVPPSGNIPATPIGPPGNGAGTEYTAVFGPYYVPPPACNASLPNTLDAGTITVTGSWPFGSVALQPSTQNGRLAYSAALAPGTLQGGAYRVMGQGGGEVGAFSANANIPAPITAIATYNGSGNQELQGGMQLKSPCPQYVYAGLCADAGYSFSWTGGDDRSMVTIQFIVGNSFQAVTWTSAGAGEIFIPPAYGTYPSFCEVAGFCTLLPEGNVEIIITQTPNQAPSEPFSAPGLGWGGEATWNYVWDFRGLTN